MTEPVRPQFDVVVPDDLQGGTYANVVSVWHSPFEFTLDFAVTQQPVRDEEGNPHVPCRVVSRIKVPTTVLFDLMRTLGDNLTRYENAYGAIKRPGETDEEIVPPDDQAG